MRWLLALFLLAALGCHGGGAARAPSAPVTARSPSDSLVVVARLEDAGTAVPHCGVVHFVVVMRYRVVRVLEGHYAEPVIYVAQGCPELSRASYGGPDAGNLGAFHVGDTHRLWLRRWTASEDGSLVDGFDKRLPRYRAVRADLETG